MEKEKDPNFEKPNSYKICKHKADVKFNKLEKKPKKKTEKELFEKKSKILIAPPKKKKSK